MEDFTKKITEEMQAFGSRLAEYEAEYASTGSRPYAETSSSEPAASAAVAVVVDRKEQGVELAEMRTAFNNLQKMLTDSTIELKNKRGNYMILSNMADPTV